MKEIFGSGRHYGDWELNMRTKEGAKQYEHSLDHAVEFFSKAGSLFAGTKGFYAGDETALSLFQKVWIVDEELAMKLLLWLRDCRGGAGNRSGARECYQWLANHSPEWLAANIGWLPLVGRWDDLRHLFGTDAEKYAVELWVEALKSKDVLAAKWADRSDGPIRQLLGMKVGDFRRLLAKLRKDHIVEHKMCTNRWNEVSYESVPSVAMARYTKAFGKHDEERFESYKESLKKGEAKVHADVLFPHDCVRTARHGDKEIADAQFDALPNFMEGTDERIMVICDTSGSMSTVVAGDIRAVDISQGLALYCSGKMPKDGPFYKKFIAFCSESEFKDWEGMTFSEAVNDRHIFDHAVGSTQIHTALRLILKVATTFKLEEDQMPTALMIVSDMQFHQGTSGDGTEIENCLKLYDKAGYNRPKVVYWNTDGRYAGSPDTVKSKDTALVSGFSTGVLKALLSGEDFSPRAVMLRALEKYDVTKP
jgi:hypothetical protein